MSNFTYEFLPHRGLTKETLTKYNIKTKIDADGRPIADGFVYPDGTSTKVRVLSQKEFYWLDRSPAAGLFGQDKFSGGENQSVIITEGEYDAASIYQSTKVPAVSVQSSSTGVRDCISSRAYLNSFGRIYLALDGDSPGRETARGIARLFDNKKLYQIKFDKYKDANDYLQHGEEIELHNLFKNAKKYQPETIVSSLDEFEKILTQPDKPSVPYPWKKFNEMLGGIRTGESVLITGLEGIGKTELMHALEYHLLKETDANVGPIFLEEPKKRHLQALAGLELAKPVHLPNVSSSPAEEVAAVEKIVGKDDRLLVYSHFGSDDPDELLDTIRFMVSSRDCRYILLDNISMAVSGLKGDDERRALDYLVSRLEMMVVELDFALIFVSHINDDGQTRGSRLISKVANVRIDVTRDQNHSDDVIKNTLFTEITKNRPTSLTGVCSRLFYDLDTCSLTELEDNAW